MKSLLFAPAHRPELVRRALSGVTGADCIIVDLEDGVPRAAQAQAAATVRQLGRPSAGEPPAICRIRGIDDGAAEDLPLVGDRFEGILLAKAQGVDEVETVSAWCAQRDRPLLLWLLIETARGLVRLDEMLDTGAVHGVMFGAGDMQADLQLGDDRRQLEAARSRIVFSSIAAGIRHIVDTPEAQTAPDAAYYESARSARGLGFTAKAAIHPAQLPAINEVFDPSPAEIERATHVLSMPDGAVRDGSVMVDEATKRWARGVLASTTTSMSVKEEKSDGA